MFGISSLFFLLAIINNAGMTSLCINLFHLNITSSEWILEVKILDKS